MFTMGRKEQAIVLIVIAVLLFTAGYQWAGRSDTAVELVPATNDSASEEKVLMVVHVDGAVEKPGIYKFPAGSRVNDAIAQAVSLPEADISSVNLAAPLKDGQKLVIPTMLLAQEQIGQQADGSSTSSGFVKKAPAKTGNSPGLVNINTASAPELEALPGIGPALSARIIEHRQANGMFLSIEELKNVSGIGEKKYASLEHLITLQ